MTISSSMIIMVLERHPLCVIESSYGSFMITKLVIELDERFVLLAMFSPAMLIQASFR